jgi:hypothetical protein
MISISLENMQAHFPNFHGLFGGLAHGFIKGTLSMITLHVLNFVQGNSKCILLLQVII